MARTRLVVAVVGLLAVAVVAAGPTSPVAADGNEGPSAPVGVRSITAANNHTCILRTDGSVKCFGQNSSGYLGLGDGLMRGHQPGSMGNNLPTVHLGTGRTATQISAGFGHVCALLDNGQVKCWGDNSYGQLGRADNQDIGDDPNEMGDDLAPVDLGPGRTATAISAGDGHTCAILDTGQLKCWGRNELGQLGLGDTTPFRGANPNTMGTNLPTVNLGAGRTAVAVSAGTGHTCVILDNASMKCWGHAGWGQLGQGQFTQDIGDQAGEMASLAPIALGTGRTALAMTAGANHTCVILDDHTVKCWGKGSSGELGNGTNNDYLSDEPDEVGDGIPTVPGITSAIAISADRNHTCAALTGGAVKCWGGNEHGKLGQGNTDFIGDAPNEMTNLQPIAFASGLQATAVTTGGEHSCAAFSNGTFRCWGRGDQGELGQGNPNDLGDGGGEMADIAAIDLGTTGPPPTAHCDGQVVTVNLALAQTPTAGNDVILGTGAANTINGLGGADRICGGGGIDTINGGPGNDRLFGDAGNDKLNGGDGTDTVTGGEGNDTITGGNQNDTASGGNGNDRLDGQNGNDTLNGLAGTDTLLGGQGNDRLNGGTQRDTCNGGTQADTQTGCEVRTSIP